MRSRSLAREIALKYLYEHDINGGEGVPTPEGYFEREGVAGEVEPFARTLIEGVLGELEALNRVIASAAQNWRLERMSAIDRNLLRIGAWELMKSPEVPGAVAIVEAVDLAKKYGTSRSGSFVNGILDRILGTARSGEKE